NAPLSAEQAQQVGAGMLRLGLGTPTGSPSAQPQTPVQVAQGAPSAASEVPQPATASLAADYLVRPEYRNGANGGAPAFRDFLRGKAQELFQEAQLYGVNK